MIRFSSDLGSVSEEGSGFSVAQAIATIINCFTISFGLLHSVPVTQQRSIIVRHEILPVFPPIQSVLLQVALDTFTCNFGRWGHELNDRGWTGMLETDIEDGGDENIPPTTSTYILTSSYLARFTMSSSSGFGLIL
jgi:hypothetical protein